MGYARAATTPSGLSQSTSASYYVADGVELLDRRLPSVGDRRPAEPHPQRRSNRRLRGRHIGYVAITAAVAVAGALAASKAGQAGPRSPIPASLRGGVATPVPGGVGPASEGGTGIAGLVTSTPTAFPGFVDILQNDLRAGQLPGVPAAPAANVSCPVYDPMNPGDVFACLMSNPAGGARGASASVVIDVTAPRGQTFTAKISDSWVCSTLTPAEVVALQRIGAAASC